MKDEYLLRQEELVENPTARLPICLVLDVSYSMDGEPIEELQKGVEMFFNAILNDEVAQYSAEISIVTFGGSVNRLLDFYSIQRQDVPTLKVSGNTPTGEAVVSALDMLETRKSEYKNAGIDYYQPWMVLMSDGDANGDRTVFKEATRRTTKLVESKKLTIFPIAIGSDANLSELAEISAGKPALKLKGLSFSDFFIWLSQSVSKVSQSSPGEEIKLDTSTVDKWASI